MQTFMRMGGRAAQTTAEMDSLYGKRLLILGLARQGVALAHFAAQKGAATITVSDLRPAAELQNEIESLRELPVHFVLGEHPDWLLDAADVVALSGSVPADAPLVAKARQRGLLLTNDSAEFMRRCPAPVIGITGSAGKTTTTALTGAIGRAAGRQTWVGGNIGHPLLWDLAQIGPQDLVVQELSSFQLELWDESPQIAAVTNITPNHLDRHGTMEIYTHAKANILRYQAEHDTAVLCADDVGSLGLAPLVRGRLRIFSAQQAVADGTFAAEGYIWLARDGAAERVCPLSDIQLRGTHNLLNVLAACALADAAALPISAMGEAISQFTGVEHRLEHVATVDGVQYINDSIATAPERALAALASFHEPLILLAGGKDKNMEWDRWAESVSLRVKAVVLFGALTEKLAAKLAAQPQPPTVVRAADLAEALSAAAALATYGDVVLLSPGGTSYDAYRDFAERGAEFRQLVQALGSGKQV